MAEEVNPLVGATSGAIAAVVGSACTYPLIVVKQRLQADSDNAKPRYRGPLDCLMQTIRGEQGLAGAFAGMTLALPKTAVWNFCFYFFFTLLRPLWEKRNGSSARAVAHGITAGIATQLVMLPVDAVNIRVTVSSDSYAKVVRDIFREGGMFSFWKGIAPGLLLTINPGIVQLLRKTLTDIRTRGGTRRPSSLENFWIGLVSKLVASAITYPLVVSKIVMTVSRKQRDRGKARERSSLAKIVQIWTEIARRRGLSGLYKGIRPHLANAALKAGILNAVRLKIIAIVLVFFRRLNRRAR
eukprot:g3541.t1